jgi:N-acetylmuramic acid 6-phosphate etherase
MNETPPDRSHIHTEQRLEDSKQLHLMDSEACLKLMQAQDHQVLSALEGARLQLKNFIDATWKGFSRGGRLIYLGAGTSGRLGVLDASEAPPTFQLEHNRIIGLIAGGDRSLRYSSEGREDLEHEFYIDLDNLNLSDRDSILGIAAGGTTPCVHGALKYAIQKNSNITTGFLSCTPLEQENHIQHPIYLATGQEVLTGSTRLKSGTATKLALNQISTTLMVLFGKVYQNLMIDLRASNSKLVDRAIRIITTLTELDRGQAHQLLISADDKVKLALVMHFQRLSSEEAQAKLKESKGHLHPWIK